MTALRAPSRPATNLFRPAFRSVLRQPIMSTLETEPHQLASASSSPGSTANDGGSPPSPGKSSLLPKLLILLVVVAGAGAAYYYLTDGGKKPLDAQPTIKAVLKTIQGQTAPEPEPAP